MSRKRRSNHAAIMLGLSLALSVGCRSGFDVMLTSDFDDADTWGGYAASLDVPDCPTDLVLTVNTTAEELDGGDTITSVASTGAQLSFVEAMWINFNRGGGGTILFDEAVFPARNPGVISLSEAVPLPNLVVPGTSVCIDGRHRGVVLQWPDNTAACEGACFWQFGPGSLVVGLTLLDHPSGAFVDATVAGCRFGTDGYETFSEPIVWVAHMYGGTFGPGNVVSRYGSYALSIRGDGTRVVGNSFGYDPLTRVFLQPPSQFRLDPGGPGENYLFEGNVFGGNPTIFDMVSLDVVTLDLRGNFFGVNAAGQELPGGGLVLGGDGVVTFGPDNTIRGVEVGVLVGAGAVRITRNVITGNTLAIGTTGTGIVLPLAPDITQAREGVVSGTCAGAGEVEIFSDPADQGETYLGTATCGAAAPHAFALATALPAGRFITAIYTDTGGHSSAFSLARAVPYPP